MEGGGAGVGTIDLITTRDLWKLNGPFGGGGGERLVVARAKRTYMRGKGGERRVCTTLSQHDSFGIAVQMFF